jgi:hypothetical protein
MRCRRNRQTKGQIRLRYQNDYLGTLFSTSAGPDKLRRDSNALAKENTLRDAMNPNQAQSNAVTVHHVVYVLTRIFIAWFAVYIILGVLGAALPGVAARGLLSERRNRILVALGAIMTAVLAAMDASVPPAPARWAATAASSHAVPLRSPPL